MVSDRTRSVILPLGSLVALLVAGVPCATASELVRFESARYQQTALQSRLARERGEAPQAAELIQGHLTKPAGDGPYAAVVILHGCTGLPDDVKTGAAKGFWSEQLESAGYVVLMVDSFTSRNVNDACTAGGPSRVADAYGALAFLTRQPFVDPRRVALLGFASGGAAALSVVEKRDAELFEGENERSFKVAVAVAPFCETDGNVLAPTLIVVGELDTRPVTACRRLMTRRTGAGSAMTLIVYPGVHHDFDAAHLQQGRRGDYWIQYDAAATGRAVQDIRDFLARHLIN